MGGAQCPSNHGWKTAVEIGDQGQLITDVGKDEFNTQFRICPVVRYEFKNLQHSVYVRTSSVPDEMDPYDYFTRHWRSTSNRLGQDFELYDSLDDARATKASGATATTMTSLGTR